MHFVCLCLWGGLRLLEASLATCLGSWRDPSFLDAELRRASPSNSVPLQLPRVVPSMLASLPPSPQLNRLAPFAATARHDPVEPSSRRACPLARGSRRPASAWRPRREGRASPSAGPRWRALHGPGRLLRMSMTVPSTSALRLRRCFETSTLPLKDVQEARC